MATPIHFANGSYGAILDGKVSSSTGLGGLYSLDASANQLLTMIWAGVRPMVMAAAMRCKRSYLALTATPCPAAILWLPDKQSNCPSQARTP